MSFGPLEILFAILGISILVIVHESGHYLVARAFKMRVLRYSIGFGPALFRYKPKDSPTTFQVCAIPFLAYVQIAGMNPHEDVDPDDPEIFPNKSLFARIATIAAGPGANYLCASVLCFFLALSGWPSTESVEPMTVGKVQDESPAQTAGLEEGDVIVEANDTAIANVTELIEVTKPRAGQETVYVVERDGERMEFTITPKENEGRGIIGVVALGNRVYEEHTLGEAATKAVVFPFEFTAAQVAGITHMITNFDSAGLKGPVGMGQIVAESVSLGPAHFTYILIVLSIALGFFNLLPLPALDGGRLVFLGYEMITRRRPNARVEALVHTVGILILLAVLVLVTYRDIVG
ncbi:MAG: M50 family metallopeptidase [Myxococcota bacterium]